MQTSVLTDLPIGEEGAIAENQLRNVVSKAVELAAGIAPGRFVARGTLGTQSVLPTSAAEITDGSLQGISVKTHSQVSGANTDHYAQYEPMPVLEMGIIWMRAEDPVSEGDRPFIRFAAGAGGTELGAVRSDADTASASEAPAAVRFASSTTGNNQLVKVRLNLPD